MVDPRFRSGIRYPDADIVGDESTRRYLFDLVDALSERDKNEAELPINRTTYPTITSASPLVDVATVLGTLLVDMRKAGIIK
jgi:hypothetical protein